MTLEKWYQTHHSDDDCMKLFSEMDYSMHEVHKEGYYIRSFNPEAIEVLEQYNKDIVKYNYLDKLDGDINLKINRNIYDAATLQLALYMGIEPSNLNQEFVKRNFSQFEIFIPNDVVNYYRRVLVNNASIYLSDYLQAKNGQEIAKLEKSLSDGGGSASSKGKDLVKRTGKYTTDDGDLPVKNDNNIAAFATNYLLAFVIISVSILIPLLVFIFSNS